jgi:hypothetical protein
MEIEKLKLILETLQGVGQEAGNLAVLYLWLQFAGSAVASLSIAGVIVGAVYFGYRAIRVGYGVDAYDTFFRSMRNQLFANTGGYLTDDELQRTMTALRQLVAEHKEKKE